MKTVLQAVNTFMKGVGSFITMIVVKANVFEDQVKTTMTL